MTAIRLDTGVFKSQPMITQDGALRGIAIVARPGVYTYSNADGTTRREYIPEEELYDRESLDSLEASPITDEHPTDMVTASNYRSLIRGSVGAPRTDGRTVQIPISVSDLALAARIVSGEQSEFSLGKRIVYDPTPGVTPNGERYDGVQRKIRYNHLAVTRKARLGDDMRLRFDSETDSETLIMTDRIDADAAKGTCMKYKTLRLDNGKDLQVPEYLFPALQAMVARKDSTESIEAVVDQASTEIKEKQTLEERIAKLEKLVAEISKPANQQDESDKQADERTDSELVARIDSLAAENNALREAAKTLADRIDSAARERSRIERISERLVPDVRLDTASNRELKLAVIAAKLPFDPSISLDTVDDATLSARFDAVIEIARNETALPAYGDQRTDAVEVEKMKAYNFREAK